MLARFIANLFKLARILSVPSWRAALRRYHVAAGAEHVAVLRHLNSCRTVIDIGANRGQFALAARHCLPAARIISFEPLPGPAAVFRSVFKQEEEVTLYHVAVGPSVTQSTMHISKRDDSSSLLPIGPLQSAIFPGTAEVAITNVSVAPLDAFVVAEDITSPALLKLDVQGFELEALMGCESLLACFEWVYCECSFKELYEGQKLVADVIKWLSENRFRLNGIFNPTYDANGLIIQADFLFAR